MIKNIFVKKLAFFVQNTASFAKFIVFKKNGNFFQKL
jgi:hypothetical protein